MRLICPNCDAQYEVQDSVIPQTGRDVQCSNCGVTWFQRPAGYPEDEDGPLIVGEAGTDEVSESRSDESSAEGSAEGSGAYSGGQSADPETAPHPHNPPESEIANALARQIGTGEEDGPPEDSDYIEADPNRAEPRVDFPSLDGTDEEAGSTPDAEDYLVEDDTTDDQPKSEPTRRPVSQSVIDLLREEANREKRARQAESGALETQPELGLAVANVVEALRPDPAPEPPPRRLRPSAAPTGEDADDGHTEDTDVDAAEPAPPSVFPDIEKINSTLRPTSERGEDAASIDAPETVRRWRSGFRLGLIGMLTLTVVLLLLYVLAPQIVAGMPALEPLLSAYVGAIDAWRGWVGGLLGGRASG